MANNGGVWRVSLVEAIARWPKPSKGGGRETGRPFFSWWRSIMWCMSFLDQGNRLNHHLINDWVTCRVICYDALILTAPQLRRGIKFGSCSGVCAKRHAPSNRDGETQTSRFKTRNKARRLQRVVTSEAAPRPCH